MKLAGKIMDISCQLPASLVAVSVETRELWWMNQKRLELRWGLHNRSENSCSAWDTL
jgi:hypothetical protein